MRAALRGRGGLLLGLAALMALSALLRTRAAGEGYWTDEGLAIGIAGASLGDLPAYLRQDGSPPLHYALLHGWMAAFGEGEHATRALSLLCALAAIPAAWWAARAQLGERAAWSAAALVATSTFLSQYAQETRPYALVALLSLLLAGGYLRAFVAGERHWLVPTALLAAAIALTHHWGLHLLAGFAGATLIIARRAGAARRRAMERDGLLVAAGVTALYAPWLPVTLEQVRRTGAPWSIVPGLAELSDVLVVPFGGVLPTVLLMGAAGLAVARTPPPGGSRHGWAPPSALGLAAVLAFALAFAGALVEPGWAGRYLAALIGPLLLAIAWALGRAGLAGTIALAAVVALWSVDGAPDPKSNVRELAGALGGQLEGGDVVIVAHPEQIAVTRHYLGADRDYATTLGPQPDARAMDWRDAVARLRAADPARTLARVRAARPRGRVLLMLPVEAATENRGTPWISLVRGRARAWERLLDADPALRRVAVLPRAGDPQPPRRGARAVLYEPTSMLARRQRTSPARAAASVLARRKLRTSAGG